MRGTEERLDGRSGERSRGGLEQAAGCGVRKLDCPLGVEHEDAVEDCIEDGVELARHV